MRSIVTAIAAVLLMVPTASAEGTLDVAPGAASTAAGAADGALRFALYGFYGTLPDGTHVKLNFTDDNRTWTVYSDADDDYEMDEGEAIVAAPFIPLDAQGSGTDHVTFTSDLGANGRVCPGDVPRSGAAADGMGRELRCGGDMDGDGDPDLHEVNGLHNPLGDDAEAP